MKSSVRIHNYGIHDGDGEEVQTLLERIPFGILAVSAADHMAMVVRGIVYEVHISEASESRDVVAASPFFSYFEKSRGGLLLVPPESAPKADFDGKVDEENPYANLDRQGQAMRRIPWARRRLDERLQKQTERENRIAQRRSRK